MTAPIASGWSEITGWVSHPLGKRRLCTTHANSCHLPTPLERPANRQVMVSYNHQSESDSLQNNITYSMLEHAYLWRGLDCLAKPHIKQVA
jgi:hypothetical protein